MQSVMDECCTRRTVLFNKKDSSNPQARKWAGLSGPQGISSATFICGDGHSEYRTLFHDVHEETHFENLLDGVWLLQLVLYINRFVGKMKFELSVLTIFEVQLHFFTLESICTEREKNKLNIMQNAGNSTLARMVAQPMAKNRDTLKHSYLP